MTRTKSSTPDPRTCGDLTVMDIYRFGRGTDQEKANGKQQPLRPEEMHGN